MKTKKHANWNCEFMYILTQLVALNPMHFVKDFQCSACTYQPILIIHLILILTATTVIWPVLHTVITANAAAIAAFTCAQVALLKGAS